MTAQEKEGRSNSGTYQTAKQKSLSRSTRNEDNFVPAREADLDIEKYTQERSMTSEDQRINATVKKSSNPPSTVDVFIKEAKDAARSGGVSSDAIRERAREILEIYEARLKEEGEKSF